MSDFFRPVVLSATADNAAVAAFQAVLTKAKQTMPWLPNLAGESAGIFYGSPPMWPALNSIPEGLDDGQQRQWKEVWAAVAPLSTAALRGEMASLKVQGQQLAANQSFWDGVYRITADIATLGVNELWGDFWDAIAEAKASRDATVVCLQVAQDALDSQGNNADPSDVINQGDIHNQLNDLVGRIINAIAPLGPDVRAQAGLGAAALVVAGITGAVIVAITASVWAIAHELASVQKQANDHAQAVLDHQTAWDEQQLAEGKISESDFVQRRALTAQQAKAVADAQGASAVGSGLQKAGMGAALGIGALALGVVGVVYLMRRSKAAAAAK